MTSIAMGYSNQIKMSGLQLQHMQNIICLIFSHSRSFLLQLTSEG